MPFSRINDGICDCCDGSDENETSTSSSSRSDGDVDGDGDSMCPNSCDTVLKEERARIAKLQQDYEIGSHHRSQEVFNFQQLRSTKLVEIDTHNTQRETLKHDIDSIGTQIRTVKHAYVQSRITTMRDSVVHNIKNNLFPDDTVLREDRTFLQKFIIHACQVSGELFLADTDFASTIPDDDAHATTCTPLRVAAMDLGLSWNINHIDDYNTSTSAIHHSSSVTDLEAFDVDAKVDMTGEMIQTVFDNAIHAIATHDDDDDLLSSTSDLPLLRWRRKRNNSNNNKNKRTQKKKTDKGRGGGRRRLQEVNDDHEFDELGLERDDDDNFQGMDDDIIYNRDESPPPMMDDDDVDVFDNVHYDDGDSIIDKDVGEDEMSYNDDRRRQHTSSTTVDETKEERMDLLDEILQTTVYSKVTQRYNYIMESETIINGIEKLLDDYKKQQDQLEKAKEEEEERRREEKQQQEKNDDEGNENNDTEDDNDDRERPSSSDNKNEEKGGEDVSKDSSSRSNNNDDPVATADEEDTVDDHAQHEMRNQMQISLLKKEEIINKGLQWGASAKLLFESLAASGKSTHNEDTSESTATSKFFTDDDLTRLAIGTIYYGQISSVQVWQIIMSILHGDDDKKNGEKAGNKTCSSPWSDYCPPKQQILVSSTVAGKDEEDQLYPPSFLIDVAKSFCNEQVVKFTADVNICGAPSLLSDDTDDLLDDNYTNNHNSDTITSFEEKYNEETFDNFGYSVPVRRNSETDPLQSMFKPIIDLPIDSKKLYELEESKKLKEKEIKDTGNSIDTLWKEIGGTDGTDLGHDGELSSIRDQCFEIVAGKYTYQVCLFAKAVQKEGTAKGGTNLGQWTGIEYEYEDNNDTTESGDTPASSSRILQRVMKWENGAKCWNGPKRSATVYMTCGREHKIISANEPDTCRYVFEMETYLACDDAYKERMGLL